jgi:hypothetical protein
LHPFLASCQRIVSRLKYDVVGRELKAFDIHHEAIEAGQSNTHHHWIGQLR